LYTLQLPKFQTRFKPVSSNIYYTPQPLYFHPYHVFTLGISHQNYTQVEYFSLYVMVDLHSVKKKHRLWVHIVIWACQLVGTHFFIALPVCFGKQTLKIPSHITYCFIYINVFTNVTQNNYYTYLVH